MLSKNKIYFLIFLLLNGCGLRDVETPTEVRSNFNPPISPGIVLQNLQFAIAEKNLNNYLQCFVDTANSTRRYSYTADVNSQAQYPVFRYWNMSNENSYFNNLKSSSNPAAASNLFVSNEVLNYTSDTAVYDASYLLRFDHNRNTVSKTLKGKLRLIMSADSRNLWAVHTWIDFKELPTDTTWSVLKANFSN